VYTGGRGKSTNLQFLKIYIICLYAANRNNCQDFSSLNFNLFAQKSGYASWKEKEQYRQVFWSKSFKFS
jgi:hypothetical protein